MTEFKKLKKLNIRQALAEQYGIQTDKGSNAMETRSEPEKEKPILDSDGNNNLNNEKDARSGNGRRKDFDRRSKVGRRRNSDRRRGNHK